MSKSALQLFKQAGIGDYLMQGLQGQGSEAQNYLVRGGAGALAGGLGMGAASYMGGDEEDPHRGRNAMGSALQGALLGGAAGVGTNALLSSRKPELSPHMQELKDQAAQHGYELDTNPYGYNHPGGQAMINLTHGSTGNAALAGAGVGIAGGMYNDRRTGAAALAAAPSAAFGHRPMTNPGTPAVPPVPPTYGPDEFKNYMMGLRGKLSDGAKDKFMRDTVNGNKSGQGLSHQEIKEMTEAIGLDNSPGHNPSATGRQDPISWLKKKLNIGGDYAGDLQRDMAMNRPGHYTPSDHGPIQSTLNRMSPQAAALYKGMKQTAGNIATHGPIPLGTAKRSLMHAGGYGLGGAAIGAGLQYGGRKAVDAYIGGQYPQEQLEAWNNPGQ